MEHKMRIADAVVDVDGKRMQCGLGESGFVLHQVGIRMSFSCISGRDALDEAAFFTDPSALFLYLFYARDTCHV